jgi:hypothetical protein
VYPEREQAEALDDVPQYIYPANPKKHHRFDTASGILKNVNQKGTFPIKGQDLKTERAVVDTLVADYLCNHHYG